MNRMDDLIDTDFGEHDYDWLIAAPRAPPLDATDRQITVSSVSRGRGSVRSVSTARPSRVVVSPSQPQNGHSAKPARSTSVTRPSILNACTTSLSVNGNNSRPSLLNTSIASVTSRPSTPSRRSTTVASSLTPRLLPARSQTPVKHKPEVKTTKPHNVRSSTPTSRAQNPTASAPHITSSSPRLPSRSSTPTRKPTNPLPASAPTRATSVGRVRYPVQPTDIPDFPSDAPPNLRTRLPERPASAGKARPGAPLTTRANLSNTQNNMVSRGQNRRHSSPIVVSHNKFLENSPTAQLQGNYGYDAALCKLPKIVVSEDGVRRTKKVPSVTQSTGFGRTISKKSIDMALRHMDIKQSIRGRATSIFPHSIRSTAPNLPARMPDPTVTVRNDIVAVKENCSINRITSPDCNGNVSCNRDGAANRLSEQKPNNITRESNYDIYGSTRYDAILLKEDSHNLSWLHSVEEKSDQAPIFDHRFEPLPEPFDLL